MKSIILNHILSVLNQESFPVIGDSTSSLIFALLFTAAVLALYIFIDHLPRPGKSKITSKNEVKYVKTMIGLILFACLSGAWDFWWHRAIGRDHFWVAPHISLYTFVTLATFIGFYVWRHSRDVVWKHIFFLLLLIPISGAWDNYFHVLWGFEDLSRPVLLSWSPAHILLNLAVIGTLMLLVKSLVRYRKTPDFSFFGNVCFGAVYILFLFLIMPFFPTGPWGQIVGFGGAGILTFFLIFILLTSEKVMQGQMDATYTAIFIFVILAASYGKEIAPNIHLTPHDRAPVWLLFASLIFTSILLDITKDRFPMWVRGLFGGIVWSGILFGFQTYFFAPQFQYGMTEIFTAVSFSAMAGLVAGSIFSLFHLDDDKHIQKLFKKW